MIFLPTDTVYGIGACLRDRSEYERIYSVKKRDSKKPLAMVVRSLSDISLYWELSGEQQKFLESYPFPFTLLAPRKDCDLFPQWVIENPLYMTIGIRVWERCGGNLVFPLEWEGSQDSGTSENSLLTTRHSLFPLWLTSANESWERECLTLQECQSIFGEVLLSTDMLIEGECWRGRPSNIFRFTGKWCEIEYTRRNYF